MAKIYILTTDDTCKCKIKKVCKYDVSDSYEKSHLMVVDLSDPKLNIAKALTMMGRVSSKSILLGGPPIIFVAFSEIENNALEMVSTGIGFSPPVIKTEGDLEQLIQWINRFVHPVRLSINSIATLDDLVSISSRRLFED